MSRVTLLCTDAARDKCLTALRDVGVLHVSPLDTHGSVDIDTAHRQLEHAVAAAAALPEGTETASDRGVDEIVDEVLQRVEEQRTLIDRIDSLKSERHRLAPLGDFNPADVAELQAQGVFVKAYRIADINELRVPDGLTVVTLEAHRDHTYVAGFGREDFELDGIEISLPAADSAIEPQLKTAQDALTACEQRLSELAPARAVIVARRHELEDEIQLLEVQSGMVADSGIQSLGGYCPDESVGDLQNAAKANGWGFSVRKPDGDEAVPTYIRNPAWVKPIKAVMDFIGVVPGYKEVDISVCFLFFFSLFFAMVVGDAGYGIICLGLTIFGAKKLPAQKTLWSLMTIMSVCTIIWGVLTGMWFGMKPTVLEASFAPLADMRIDWLTNADKDNNSMFLCFLIGAIHLTLAHSWTFCRYINSPRCLAQAGWIMTTWTMFLTACTMVLGKPFPEIGIPLLIVGVVLIVLFMTPVKRWKDEWFEFIMLPLNLVSNFVDVVSYVRLFAVGMATFAVANAVNEMAMDFGFTGVISGLICAVILFAGHVLNIALAGMGVLVHGVRLNTLEFSGHLGMEWTGRKYQPLAPLERE